MARPEEIGRIGGMDRPVWIAPGGSYNEHNTGRRTRGDTMNTKSQVKFTPLSFLLRWLFAACLVLLTYNPSTYSFYHWVRSSASASELGPEHALVGVILFIGWAMFIRATLRSLGAVGLLLGAAFFAALIWLLDDIGILQADSVSAITWIALICLSGLLAIGMSWSHIRRRLSGQYDVDDIEN